jgi:hypothetical protein
MFGRGVMYDDLLKCNLSHGSEQYIIEILFFPLRKLKMFDFYFHTYRTTWPPWFMETGSSVFHPDLLVK